MLLPRQQSRLRAVQRLADQRAGAEEDVETLQEELNRTRAAQREAEKRAAQSMRQMEELQRTLTEKMREMELQQERRELALELQV